MAVAEDAALVSMSSAPTQTVFEPGPSFNEHPTAGSSGQELPGWLQSFGGSVQEPSISPMAMPDNPAPTPANQPPASDLPTWLAAPRADAPPPGPAAAWDLPDVKFGSNDDGGFISEDDLPDWLRSIGNELSPDEPINVAGQTNGVNAVASRTLQTPTVVSAWVTGRQTVALADGESLFAHIASEEQHVTDLPGHDSEDETRRAVAAAQTFATPVAAAAVSPDAQSSQRAKRYLLYLAIAVVLVLVILMAQR